MLPLKGEDFAWPHSREHRQHGDQAFSEIQYVEELLYLLPVQPFSCRSLCCSWREEKSCRVSLEEPLSFAEFEDLTKIPFQVVHNAVAETLGLGIKEVLQLHSSEAAQFPASEGTQ